MKTNQSLLILIILLLGCVPKKEKDTILNSYRNLDIGKNVLNYSITPSHKFDKKGLMFSDQGAWFAYGLTDSIGTSGFSGPFLMTQQNGIWSAEKLACLNVKGQEWELKEMNSYPSHLEQILESEELFLKQELVFFSGHTALICYTFKNKTVKNIVLDYEWRNTTLLGDGLKLSALDNKLEVISSKTKAKGYLIFPEKTQIDIEGGNYVTQNKKLYLSTDGEIKLSISQTFIFPEYSWEQEKEKINAVGFDKVLLSRKHEKETQLEALFKKQKEPNNQGLYKIALAKAYLTLQNNWRIPAGEIKREGLFPSYHYKWFNGFWSWDSWKHAVGLSYYDTDLAKEQVQLMFDFQAEDGFVADCVFRDTTIEKHNYRDTKPPLSAWAVSKIYKMDRDISFIKHMYPRLKKYHEWWYKKRDHDKDSICEYGSTDGTLVAAKWESGMDNAIRFDNSEILKNDEGAFSLNQESVDLNAYLYAEKKFLTEMAKEIGLFDDVLSFEEEAEKLKVKIQQQFYDEADGWFYDTSLDGNSFVKGEGSEGWIALWAMAASKEQAQKVMIKMMDTTKFFTRVPFQTMSADNPKFDPLKGYWRGPNWLDQAYFGVRGLRNYGFDSEADRATIEIFTGAQGLTEKGPSIRENYHPVTGEGLNAQNFSWSAAHIIMLLCEE